jgi:hypothetical protein
MKLSQLKPFKWYLFYDPDDSIYDQISENVTPSQNEIVLRCNFLPISFLNISDS